jgi:hypothetical protein
LISAGELRRSVREMKRMIDCYGFRTVFARVTLIAGLFVGFDQSALADSVALSLTGMVTSSSVNGAQLGAGDYTAQQLLAAGSAVGTVTANGMTGISLWSLLGGEALGNFKVITSTPAGIAPRTQFCDLMSWPRPKRAYSRLSPWARLIPSSVERGACRTSSPLELTEKPELVFPGHECERSGRCRFSEPSHPCRSGIGLRGGRCFN